MAGVPSELFVEEPKGEFICNICQEVLNDPVVMKCDHIGCRKCITTWLGTKRSCPLCRKDVRAVDLVAPPEYFLKLLHSLKRKCPHAEEGCAVVFPLCTCHRAKMFGVSRVNVLSLLLIGAT
jgi:C3HC4-type zinc finger (RING finger) protein